MRQLRKAPVGTQPIEYRLSGFLFVALALYELLKGVNRRYASLMVTLVVVAIPIAFLNELNSIAALALVRGADFLHLQTLRYNWFWVKSLFYTP